MNSRGYSWNFEPKRNMSKGMRLVNFKNELRKFADRGIGMIVFEQATGRHKGPLIVMGHSMGGGPGPALPPPPVLPSASSTIAFRRTRTSSSRSLTSGRSS